MIPTIKYHFTFNGKNHTLAVGSSVFFNDVQVIKGVNLFTYHGQLKSRSSTNYKLINIGLTDTDSTLTGPSELAFYCDTCMAKMTLPRYHKFNPDIFLTDEWTDLNTDMDVCKNCYEKHTNLRKHFIEIKERYSIRFSIQFANLCFTHRPFNEIFIIDEITNKVVKVKVETNNVNFFFKKLEINNSISNKLLENYKSILRHKDLGFVLKQTKLVRFVYKDRFATTILGNIGILSEFFNVLISNESQFERDPCIKETESYALIDLEKMVLVQDISQEISKSVEETSYMILEVINYSISGLFEDFLNKECIFDYIKIVKAFDLKESPILSWFENECIQNIKLNELFFTLEENKESFKFILENPQLFPLINSLF